MALVPMEEYQQRVERLQKAMREHGLALLGLFADASRPGNVKYIADITPGVGVSDISLTFAAIPAEGEPVIFASEMIVQWAAECSSFKARPFRAMAEDLAALGRAARGGKIGMAGLRFMPAHFLDKVRAGLGSSEFQYADRLLGMVKAKKSPAELALMAVAGKATSAGLAAFQAAVCDPAPKTERDVARAIVAAIHKAGGDGPSFDVFVQSGPRHSTYPIIEPTDRVIVPGDSVLTDFGARYRYYVTDIARGAVWQARDKRQEDIIRVSAAAVDAACDAIRPGVTTGKVNDIIETVIREAGYAEFSHEAAGHGSGHGIGLDVEEDEPWIRRDSTFVLEENMVFAVKSSIYLPNLAGVRVEENVRVTADGCEVMTPSPRCLIW